MKVRSIFGGDARSNVETLEARRLMSATLGTNLVVNPGAETYTGTANGGNIITPTGWTRNDNATVAPYTYSPSTLALPPSAGNVRFIGGPNSAESDFFQTIDLSALATQIDAGTVKFNLSAYLGGVINQGDNATVFANFNSPANGLVLQPSVGPVSSSNTGNQTGLILKSTTGTIPKTVRSVQIQIHFERLIGTYDEAQADNLSLVLTGPATGTISGTVFNDANGDGALTSGETGVSGAKVFLDTNGNGTLDSGETSVTTSSTGAYSFTGLAAGTYTVREVLPAGFRATTANPLSVAVASGAVVTGKNFGDTQTVLISGSVFNDTNGDGLLSSGETGLANVKVFIDKNNNGLLDSGEVNVTTSSTGAYAFAPMAPGTYSVREVVPATYRATTANPLTVALASGQTVSGKTFGDSQTVLITGTVFKDTNGNKKQDSGEAGIAGATVYLDFNNNGQLDSFELQTTTSSTGTFSFVVPFGTYTIREVLPSGFTTQTVTPATLTLAKGAVSSGNLFGDK